MERLKQHSLSEGKNLIGRGGMEGSGLSSFKKKWIYASFVYVYNVLATSKMIEKALMLTLGLKYSLMKKK